MTTLNFHNKFEGEVITLDSDTIVTVVETLKIEEEKPTGMPYDKWAEVRASDGREYRIWDNGEVDLIVDRAYVGDPREDVEERIGTCWALCDRYFAPVLASAL